MSHDFAFWDSDEPIESDEAEAIYSDISRNGISEKAKPSAKIAILARDIQSGWPPPDRGREDEWPLAAPIEISESHLIICLVPSRLWDVWPTLGQLAKEHELVMYDPQQRHVYLPSRLSRTRTRVRAKKKRPPAE
jgi:hypothetical protein